MVVRNFDNTRWRSLSPQRSLASPNQPGSPVWQIQERIRRQLHMEVLPTRTGLLRQYSILPAP
jgi:hypothetical protein